ncbi:unnamed protein product [Brassica napus]|uniref:(rape) hypothetical protein n=1 Tax=Brassica napus TaxID=3708 RepID=A0A816YB79_BRANA|nr:unnamed protein product [Brassica napus]
MVEAVLCGALFLLWNGSDTDIQLVSSQAPTVDNRRTKLLETSVYALIVCPLILDL